ncbi:MAG: dihydroorotase [Cyclobacteriaceae bacterium]
MGKYFLANANIVNEGKVFSGDVIIDGDRISKVGDNLSSEGIATENIIDLNGKYLLPGLIDDQVHFREPGLTHKGNIFTESRAAVAGGITSFMEMPNTVPNALTQELLEDKYLIGAKDSIANFSFFMGASNDNLEEVLKTDKNRVCGVKVFMGSSTGNMLVDSEITLSNIFSKVDHLIATHCEDEETIRKNTAIYREKFGDDIPFRYHPVIRSEEACFLSSSKAVEMAKKHDARLHVLHISTGKECNLFDNSLPLEKKMITAEACTHHLWFCDEDYASKGSHIKWNPAVKTAADRDTIWKALLDDRIDVLATDHAPHTIEEKSNSYFSAPSGGPLVQHALVSLMEFKKEGRISIEKIVEKACHNPAILFRIKERGYIREGYYADLVVVDPDSKWTVSKGNIMAKCGWSPFEGQEYSAAIFKTFVNGNLVYSDGKIIDSSRGKRLLFESR